MKDHSRNVSDAIDFSGLVARVHAADAQIVAIKRNPRLDSATRTELLEAAHAKKMHEEQRLGKAVAAAARKS